MRVLIAGGPKTGKTTLAKEFHGGPILHTDDLINLDWSEQSLHIARWLSEPDPWVIEGVAVVRGLRKWLRFSEEGLPFDHLIYLTKPLTDLRQGQSVMGRATRTMWDQIAPTISVRATWRPVTIEFR